MFCFVYVITLARQTVKDIFMGCNNPGDFVVNNHHDRWVISGLYTTHKQIPCISARIFVEFIERTKK